MKLMNEPKKVCHRQIVFPKSQWIYLYVHQRVWVKIVVCGKVGSDFQETTRAATKRDAPALSCKTPLQETNTDQCLQPQTAAAALNQNRPQTAIRYIHSTSVASVGFLFVSCCNSCKLFSGFFSEVPKSSLSSHTFLWKQQSSRNPFEDFKTNAWS